MMQSTQLFLKDGIQLNGTTLEMLSAMPIIVNVYRAFDSDATITSGLDGKHSSNSYHYDGDAQDYRVWDVMDTVEKVATEIRNELCRYLDYGGCFDVVVEYRNDEEGNRIPSHIHVEFDRRRYETKRHTDPGYTGGRL